MAHFVAYICLAAVFAAVTALSVVISDLPYFDKKNGSVRLLVWTACLAANAAVLFLLHLLFRGDGNLLRTLRMTVDKKLSYQSTEYIFGSLLLWIPLAVAVGFAVRAAVLTKLGEDMPFISPDRRRFTQRFMTFDLSLLGIVIIASIAFCSGGTRHLKLTEVCDAKVGRVSDGGYIELFNDGSLPCRTDGLYLSNDEDNLRKYALPSKVVGAEKLLLIPLESSVFSLSRSGGTTVILSDGSGRIIDRVEVDQEREGTYSYCRVGTSGQWAYMVPTPGEKNAASVATLSKPEFSAAAGYYPDEFDVTISAGEGAEIHYTTDGTTPTADSPVYGGPVHVRDRSDEPTIRRSRQDIVYDWKNYTPDTSPVRKAFVIRAVAVGSDGTTSEESVVSYFVGQNFETCGAVISLVADDEDLFGEDGMYITGKTYDDWYLGGGKGDRPTANFDVKGRECAASFEYFGDGKTLTFAQKSGLRIQGGSTRWLPLKRFSVFARKEYSGRNTFPVEFFKGRATHSVVLRTGFENAVSMYTVPDRDVATVECVPVAVYLNGEFWYDTYMQEKYNNTYFRQTFGVREVEFYKTGINDEILGFIGSHDLTEDKDYEAFGKIIDIQSYIDYICANVYLGNTDYNEYANTAMWRTSTRENDSYGDGRWRWAFYDMDLQTEGCRMNYGMTDITDAQLDTFNIVCDWDPPVNQRQIYCALKKNAGFRRQFVLSMMDMINNNFAEEKMDALLKRFGSDISWHAYFFRDRPDNMIAFTAKEFGLQNKIGLLTVTSNNPAAGSIRVNTSVVEFHDGSWSGRYFYEYPVTVTAVPNPGYRFAGWADGRTDSSIEITIDGGARADAIFEKE